MAEFLTLLNALVAQWETGHNEPTDGIQTAESDAPRRVLADATAEAGPAAFAEIDLRVAEYDAAEDWPGHRLTDGQEYARYMLWVVRGYARSIRDGTGLPALFGGE